MYENNIRWERKMETESVPPPNITPPFTQLW